MWWLAFLICTNWAKAYGDSVPVREEAYSVHQTLDTGYIVAGVAKPSYDFLVIKLAFNGDVDWAKTFGGSNNDWAYSVQQTSDTGYIVVGGTDSYGAGNGDILVIKLNSIGDISWAKTFGVEVEEAYSVQQTQDSGYIVAGWTSHGAGNSNFLVIKLSSTGEINWAKILGGTNTDWAQSAQQTSDTGYIVAGKAWSYGVGESDFLLIKLNSTGDISWAKTFGNAGEDVAYSVQQTLDTGYIVVGDWDCCMAGPSHPWVIKLTSVGDIIWAKIFTGPPLRQFARSVQQTSDTGYIVAGYTCAYGAGSYDFLVMKLESDGSMDGSCPIQDCTPDTTSPTVTVTSPSLDTSSPSIIVNNCTIETSSVTPTVTEICGGTGVEERNEKLEIRDWRLQIYPNPCMGKAVIRYTCPFSVSGHEPRTRITIYDVAGKLVHTLVDKEMEPGYYDIDWHPEELKAGIYFAKLSAGNYSLTKKLILLY